MTMAERELGAFISAVTELFGPEQVRLAVQDWMDELVLMEALPGVTSRDWRLVTIAASARLANRVNASSHRVYSSRERVSTTHRPHAAPSSRTLAFRIQMGTPPTQTMERTSSRMSIVVSASLAIDTFLKWTSRVATRSAWPAVTFDAPLATNPVHADDQ
jgi:hypothetical protein